MNEREKPPELVRDSIPWHGLTHDASRVSGRLFEIDNIFVSLRLLQDRVEAGEDINECLDFLFDKWQDRKTVLSERLEIILKEVGANE